MKTELKSGEKVIHNSQQHWSSLIGSGILMAAGVIAGLLIGGKGLIVALLFALYFVYKIMQRKNNIWVVTNLRVIDEFGVFSSNSKESPLDKINNVSYSQSAMGKMFGYGNIQIQTAAEIGATTYIGVDNPKQLKDVITQMQEEYKHTMMKKQAAELASAIGGGQQARPDVASELEKLHDLKQKGILTEEEFNARKERVLSM